MTDTTPSIPENIGRNDPCPCGSGRKYKKCCQRSHRLQREENKRSRGVEDIIGSQTNPWKFFKTMRQIHDNNMVSLFFDCAHDQGPLRARFTDKSSFIRATDAGDETLVASKHVDLRRFRIDSPDVYLLLTEGLDDPRTDDYLYTIVTLRPNEVDAAGNPREVDHPGPRIWDIQRHSRAKSSTPDGDLSFADLGLTWA